MLKIDLSKQAQKFLKSLPGKYAKQIARKLYSLREDPYPPDAKLLKGYFYWRSRCGEYRVIYEVKGETLLVYFIGRRNDDQIYRMLKRAD